MVNLHWLFERNFEHIGFFGYFLKMSWENCKINLSLLADLRADNGSYFFIHFIYFLFFLYIYIVFYEPIEREPGEHPGCRSGTMWRRHNVFSVAPIGLVQHKIPSPNATHRHAVNTTRIPRTSVRRSLCSCCLLCAFRAGGAGLEQTGTGLLVLERSGDTDGTKPRVRLSAMCRGRLLNFDRRDCSL